MFVAEFVQTEQGILIVCSHKDGSTSARPVRLLHERTWQHELDAAVREAQRPDPSPSLVASLRQFCADLLGTSRD